MMLAECGYIDAQMWSKMKAIVIFFIVIHSNHE